jgi:hypothetical protein
MSSAGGPTIDAASTKIACPRMADACSWAPKSSVLPLNRLRGRLDGLKAKRVTCRPVADVKDGHVAPRGARTHYDAAPPLIEQCGGCPP